jgi:outer membrane autotransporter protein
MVVGGDTAGLTLLRVVNAGGSGARTTGNGIGLIEVAGASNGLFGLAGRVAAGAYDYNLFHNGVGADAADGNWYLRSSLRPEVALDMAVPALTSRLGLAMLGTYNQRRGDSDTAQGCMEASGPGGARSGGASCNTLAWGRVFGETGSSGGRGQNSAVGGGGPAYSFDYGGVQAGVDLWRTGQDGAGLYVGAATMWSRVKVADTGRVGRMGMEGYSLGAYWTHHDPAGWYTDLVVQGTLYDHIRTISSAGQRLETRGWGILASAEAGYAIELGNGYSVIPQGQLIYQRNALDGGRDQFGRIAYDATNEVYGRLGARLTRNWPTGTGQVVRGWVETNLWHQFGADAKTTFSGLDGMNPTGFRTQLGGSWAQLVVGVSGQLTRNVSVFGSVDYNVSLDRIGHGFGGRAGIRVAW